MTRAEADKSFRTATRPAYGGTGLAIAGLTAAALWWPTVFIALAALPFAMGGLAVQRRALDAIIDGGRR